MITLLLLLLLFVSVIIFKKITEPMIVFQVIWLLQLIAYEMIKIYPMIDLNYRFLIYIYILLYFGGGFLYKIYSCNISSNKKIMELKISRKTLKKIIILLNIFIFALNLFLLKNFFESRLSLSKYMLLLRLTTLEKLPIISSDYTRIISNLIIFNQIFLFILIEYKANLKKVFISILNSIFFYFMIGARWAIINCLISTIYFILLKENSNKKILKTCIKFSMLIIILFSLIGFIRGGGNFSLETLSIYLFGSFKGVEYANEINRFVPRGDIYIIKIFELISFGNYKSSFSESQIADYFNLNDKIETNAYSIFGDLISNYGFVGAGLFLFLLGIFMEFLYQNSKRNFLYGLVLSIFMPAIILSFFNNSLLGNMAILIRLIFLIILYRMYIIILKRRESK